VSYLRWPFQRAIASLDLVRRTPHTSNMTADMRGLDHLHRELHRELSGEHAFALGRIAGRMEAALADLRAFDDVHRALDDAPRATAAAGELPAAERGPERAERELAAERVWFYIVQRESLGWYEHDDALAFYGVPAEVIVRIGPRVRGQEPVP